jgi:PTS system cellobiose-specific IIB component
MALRIAIVCGGGFSSSALARNLQKQAEKKGYADRVSFEYVPYHDLKVPAHQEGHDIALLCPHLEWRVKGDAELFSIPIYIIPPKLYGIMPVEDLVEDAEDCMKMWETDKSIPLQFPDEPLALSIKRTVSHRRYLEQQAALKAAQEAEEA